MSYNKDSYDWNSINKVRKILKSIDYIHKFTKRTNLAAKFNVSAITISKRTDGSRNPRNKIKAKDMLKKLINVRDNLSEAIDEINSELEE